MAQQTLTIPPDIRNALKYLNVQDAQAFLRKFQQQRKDSRQLAHTRMELIAGVFGAMMGFTPRYEPKLEGQTPDWLFLDRQAKPHFFGDVLNFHMNERIEKKMEDAFHTHHEWGDELPGSEERLYRSLQGKAVKYRELADRIHLPFVVFVYGWFEAFLHPMEVEYCLRARKCGLFKDYPQLSGVYHFDDAVPLGHGWVNPGYRFCFYANPNASPPLTLDNGVVPIPIPAP